MALTLDNFGLDLVCDGCGQVSMLLREADAAAALRVASRLGWKETYTAKGEKLWLGPCCSGKVRSR